MFENASGVYAIWDMSGTTIVGGGTFGEQGSGWTFAGIADLNGNHEASILFESTSGEDYETWQMNDTSILGGTTLGTAAGWSFRAIV